VERGIFAEATRGHGARSHFPQQAAGAMLGARCGDAGESTAGEETHTERKTKPKQGGQIWQSALALVCLNRKKKQRDTDGRIFSFCDGD
jgi:hypothetical protein